MRKIYNELATTPYCYYRHEMSDIITSGFFAKITKLTESTTTVGRGKYAKTYMNIYCGFDIETYTTKTNNAFMYVWQFSIATSQDNMHVIIGRTWECFDRLLNMLIDGLMLDTKHRLLVWIANCSYEWQFIRKRLEVTDYFFKDERHPLKFSHNDCIDFQDCLPISGGNLDYLSRTYTNTKKAINDLDYTIPRNSKTKLEDNEINYCCNDVLILSEWSMYYFEYYMNGGCGYKSAPLTMQSTIRHDIKQGAKKWWVTKGGNAHNIAQVITSCFPTEETYNYIMTWCFRGGYTHGNLAHVGDLLTYKDKIASYDFTSSYPSVMEHCYVPSRLYKRENVTVEQYMELIKKYCVIATIKFTNIESTTQHSIESYNKCIVCDDYILDNGRVRIASKLVVCLTELDFRTYTKFYKWDKMEIVNCLIANRVKLPDYVLKPMEKDYTDKAIKKSKGLNYAVSKSRVNSYYGVMVTRQNVFDVKYLNDEYIKEPSLPYETQINRLVLLPQWGIYITAHARKHILDLCYKCGDDCLYIDTDSIKVRNAFNYEYLFKQYNKRIFKLNKKICEQRKLDYKIFKDLGALDLEVPKIWYLKYLGAKRYIYTSTKKGKLVDNQTIAGLPKGTLINKYPNRKEMYNNFKDDMEIDDCGKLCSYYNDEPTSELIIDNQGNECVQTELSNVGLSQTTFTLSLDEHWVNYFMSYQQTLINKEVRK